MGPYSLYTGDYGVGFSITHFLLENMYVDIDETLHKEVKFLNLCMIGWGGPYSLNIFCSLEN